MIKDDQTLSGLHLFVNVIKYDQTPHVSRILDPLLQVE